MKISLRKRRAGVPSLAVAMLALVLLVGSGALAAPGGSASGPAKIAPAVLQDAAEGETTFWAVMKQQADLSPAYGIWDWTARGAFVVDRLQAVADQSQADLRAFLDKKGVEYQPFWILNAIRVTAGADIVNDVARQPGVDRIEASRTYEIPEPIEGDQVGIQTVEWGIERINAPDVWSGFGIRGEGIVVANIDTGVQFDHPAVVEQYRGNLGGGSFDHNYNWFDPSEVCGSPSLEPCDNAAHGTHTMGTMVGDDGDPGPNQIGVAPHAEWIAAKGCEDFGCSDFALLESGEWVLAPTDLNGENPRPDLRPHVVNNSWGTDAGGDTFYQATVQSWVASGIFPSFSNGNNGFGFCGSVGAPASYPESYGVGAFDINDNIAVFSSLGPSPIDGGIKPDISAPGVDVRSSVPDDSYASFSGTSMAAPHLSGAVALMWSAAPALIGDVAGTRVILDNAAIDTEDLLCGGTADDNNVWGEGRLDALAAVEGSPIGDTGTLEGTVTDEGTGDPIAGATIHAVGPFDRTTTTDSAGDYSILLPVGTYDVTASAFGYISETVTGVEITVDATTTQDFALEAAPSHEVSGVVTDDLGNPIEGATVTILGTPIPPATTAADGSYSFPSVPEGEYDVQATAGGCNETVTQHLVVDGDETLDFVLPHKTDAFGYFCDVVEPAYVEASDVLALSGDDSSITIDMPFPFTLYGESYSQADVATNGFVTFNLGNFPRFDNEAIPNPNEPNAAIYPYWDDLFVDAEASVRTQLMGTEPNREFVIEWRNVHYFADDTRRVDLEIILMENGWILAQYRNIADDGREQGNSATLGLENGDGTDAFQFSFNQEVIESPEYAILYQLPPSGFIEGHVTDANDGLPLAGATVRALQDGTEVRSTTTDAEGFYRFQVPLGTYTVEASKTNYQTETAEVTVDEENETVVQDFALETALAVVDPDSLEFILVPGDSETQTLTLTNEGTVDLVWEVKETGGAPAARPLPRLPKNPDADPNAMDTRDLYLDGTAKGVTPDAPGDVITSWPPTGLELAWGVGYNGNVWLSDVISGGFLCGDVDECQNHEFDTAGTPTGTVFDADWAEFWPADMAYDATRGLMCQVHVGGDNGIYCWDINTGDVTDVIAGAFDWTGISQRGLAYRPDDDTFYIGGWNEGILYHVAGLSHPTPGEVLDSCFPDDPNISGLAWNEAFGIVWAATNSETDTIYQLDPSTCDTLASLAHPQPFFNGAGLELDVEGNLWMISQFPNTVYLVESGLPSFVDVPWLSEDPTSGVLGAGESQEIAVTADATGLAPGVYTANLVFLTNSGREPTLRVPVTLIVPAYRQAVNAGGPAYTDVNDDEWAADQEWSDGSWGYIGMSQVTSTTRPIEGTEDDPLYQDARQGEIEYRFDGLAPGVYQIELRFAELRWRQAGRRLFDVTAEGEVLLFRHDIFAEVGRFAADDHSFIVEVSDGQLNVNFWQRGVGRPLINALRVTHRPDME
jgi:subtilisin family serine protease